MTTPAPMNRQQRRQLEQQRARQRAQRRVERPVHIPMMRKLRDQISLDMHLALARLRTAPHDDARTDLASTIHTVGVAIANNRRFAEELDHLNAGAEALQAYAASAPLTDEQLAVLAHTCAVIDTILGLIDVPTLWQAEKVAIALVRQQRAAQEQRA
ncbi:hypothetical protein CEG14_05540 [Bordetella genomosp. 1]|uniref:Uncharacterized protein n=1 Tax=Bordetella genomosp. 1 TaxID=1395607 RepID=A0A261SNN7_9BORD|nr:hypothetical protein [Bordetella genomosp. 1]OZI38999.1 hypothetical protein CEG14_05540 [Bordetella genomosp. 1]